MAISNLLSSNIIGPVYNNQNIVINSTNINEIRFKYLTNINLLNDNRLIRSQPAPNGFGFIEINNILKDYIRYEKNMNIDTLGQGPNKHFLEYELDFGEEYVKKWVADDYISPGGGVTRLTTDSSLIPGASDIEHNYVIGDLIQIDPSVNANVLGGRWRITDIISPLTIQINQIFQSGPQAPIETYAYNLKTTQFNNLLSGKKSVLFNGVLSFNENSEYNQNKYIISTLNQTDTNLITNTPKEIEVNIDDYFTFNYFNREVDLGDLVRVSFLVNDTVNFINDVPNTYGTVGVGPANFELTYPGVLSIGDYYDVRVFNTSTINQSSKTYRFRIVERCSKYTNNKIVWLDRMGGFKSFNFELHSSKTVNTTKNIFTKENIGKYDQLNNKWVIDKTEFGDTIQHSNFEETYFLSSDRLTQNQIYLLEDLNTSKYVFHYVNGEFLPIIIENNSYEVVNLLHKRKQLTNLSFKYSNKNLNN